MICSGCGIEIGGSGSEHCPYCGSVLAEENVSSCAVKSLADEVLSGDRIFEKSIRGVLEIMTEDGRGSGFLITHDGYALTNTHVVVDAQNKECRSIIVKLLDEKVSAKIVELGDRKGGYGNGVDLAVLKLSEIPNNASPLEFDNSQNVKNGEKVYAIGNSLGDGTCITSGIVSDNDRVFAGSKQYIMTDCAINPGNSGGPLLNSKGKVIGINVMIRRNGEGGFADGMKYAIPSNTAKAFVNKYLA